MRDVLIGAATLISGLGFVAGLFGLFSPEFHTKALRITLVSVATFVGVVILVGVKNDDWARQDGFLNAADKSAAQKAGITDAAMWPARRNELEDEAARNEASAKAAGFDGYTAQQAAMAEGITTGAEWKKRLAQKLAEEEAKKRYPLKVGLSSFASDYNLAAMQMGVSTRFAKIECPWGSAACRYGAGDSIQAMLTSKSQKDDLFADSIAVVFSGQKSQLPEFFVHVGVIMSMVAPSASRDERGVAIKTLLEGFKRKIPKGQLAESEVILHGFRFRLGDTNGMGLWLFVNDARVKEKG